MAHSHEKPRGCSSYPALHVSCDWGRDWPHDCSNRGVEEIIRWLAGYKPLIIKRRAGYIAANQANLSNKLKKKGRLDYILHQGIYLSEPIFSKLANCTSIWIFIISS